MGGEDEVAVIKIGYDKVENVQKALLCVKNFIGEMGKLNSSKDSDGIKNVLKGCERGLEEFNDAKALFASEPETLKVLDEGTKLLAEFNKNVAELIRMSEEHEKKHGKDSKVELKLDAKACPAIKNIEVGFKDIMNWANNLQATYLRTGIKINEEF